MEQKKEIMIVYDIRERMRDTYSFMMDNQDRVSGLLKLIVLNTNPKNVNSLPEYDDYLTLQTSKSGIILSEGVPGPTPGVNEEGIWREYTTEELNSSLDVEVGSALRRTGIKKHQVILNNEPTLIETNEMTPEDLSLIARLEQTGVLNWHFKSDDGSDRYSAHRDIVDALMPYVNAERVSLPAEEMSSGFRRPRYALKIDMGATDDQVATTYQKLLSGLDDRLDSDTALLSEQDQKLADVDRVIMATIQRKREGHFMNKKVNGQPFLGEVVVYEASDDSGLGEQMQRVCGLCYMRDGSNTDCDILGKPAHDELGYTGKFLPPQIDGMETGYFCNHWTDFRCE